MIVRSMYLTITYSLVLSLSPYSSLSPPYHSPSPLFLPVPVMQQVYLDSVSLQGTLCQADAEMEWYRQPGTFFEETLWGKMLRA